MKAISRRLSSVPLCCGIFLRLGLSGCGHASAKDACPDLEKQGAIQAPYSIPELSDMIITLEDESSTDNDTLNKDVAQALSNAKKLKAIEQGGPGDANTVEQALSNQMQASSNLCSQIVSSP